MIRWIKQYNEANPQTKYFVLNGLVYGLAIIITTIYCYGRLDFVRSYPAPSTVKNKQIVDVTHSQQSLNKSK